MTSITDTRPGTDNRALLESHLQALIGYFSGHPQMALAAVFAAASLEPHDERTASWKTATFAASGQLC